MLKNGAVLVSGCSDVGLKQYAVFQAVEYLYREEISVFREKFSIITCAFIVLKVKKIGKITLRLLFSWLTFYKEVFLLLLVFLWVFLP